MSSNSEYLDGIPTTPNTVSDSWQPAVEQIDTTKKGWFAVSLSNWDTSTTKPEVLAGSEIEAAGGVVRVSTNETILDDPGGIASGTLYLVVDFSGSDPEWYFTNDAPVWNSSLNGFYEVASGSVNWRYTGHRLEWDGATSYTEKYLFSPNKPGGETLGVSSEGIQVYGFGAWAGTYGTQTVNTTWVIPAGAYMIAGRDPALSPGYALQISSDGGTTWFPSFGTTLNGQSFSGFVVSDGVNYRIQSSASITVYYRKIW